MRERQRERGREREERETQREIERERERQRERGRERGEKERQRGRERGEEREREGEKEINYSHLGKVVLSHVVRGSSYGNENLEIIYEPVLREMKSVPTRIVNSI